MMGDRWLYYVLCAWAGLSLAFLYALVLGRSPAFPEVFVIGFFIQKFIETVTIPFLEENRVMLPGIGYARIAGPGTGIEGDKSKGKVVKR